MLNFFKSKESEKIKSLEDEIYNLKAKILDQEKIIKFTKSSSQSRLALEQIKKIESLEAEVKRQKKRVQDAKIVAQEAHKVKSEFLSNIRHEIRTPMNSIIVFAELLVQEATENKLKNYAKNIYVSGRKLLEMIDNIIELSSVESGVFKLKEEPVDIKALVEKIIKSQREEAAKKGLELTLDIDDVLPDSLMLDKEKVEDIFTNLIENAVKFTQSGYVHVKLLENGKDIVKNAINLSLVVEDSGPGIDEEDQSKIFEIFEQAVEDQKSKSMGLGLSINKRVARQMNGDIYLESHVGKGSKFIFTINSAEVVLPSANSKEMHTDMIDFSLIRPEGGTIIVIDESSELRDLVRESFLNSAIKVLSYDNPRDAIEALKKSKVDMILIDAELLTSDDNAVSKILKGISNAPVVTLTDKRIKDLDLRSSASEIVGHLKKPLLKSELFKVSVSVLNTKEEALADEKPLDEDESYDHLDQEKIQSFLQLASKNLDALYEEAKSTNDLESIKHFAEELLSVSLDAAIEEFVSFANELLVKIELFEIESINSMMQEYSQKISRLKNSVV